MGLLEGVSLLAVKAVDVCNAHRATDNNEISCAE